jgi:hypothetical protein
LILKNIFSTSSFQIKMGGSMHKAPLYVAGTIFGIVALAHLYRLFSHFNVIVGTTEVPYSANILGAIFFAALSFWMFFSACCSRCCSK